MKIYITIFLAITLFTVHEARAEDWSVQIPITSWHKSDEYNYNDNNMGLIAGYKWLRVGRYKNSYYEHSNLIALEAPIWEWKSVKFSFSGGIADGYPDDNLAGWGEYMPFSSINAQWGYLKVMYAYKVAGIGLQVDW